MSVRLAVLPGLVLLLGACSSTRSPGVPDAYQAQDITEVIELTESELAAGETRRAFDRMAVASETSGLEPADRALVQGLLNRAAEARLVDLSAPGSDPKELERMLGMDLPRRIAVRAGVRAAQLRFEQGLRKKAFKVIKKIDKLYPHHQERAAAGKLLADIGFSWAADPGRYGLFFRYRDLAPDVFEYLVLNYPSEPRCDDVYWSLAETYERERHWDLAIQRHQDLILWHAESPYAPASAARIPHLRLAALDSPEYDRRGLQLAQTELNAWILDHGTEARGELEDQVRFDLAECRRRLARNDIVVARFYRRVKNADGAEFHARRAMREAQAGFDDDQAAEAEKLLREVLARAERSSE